MKIDYFKIINTFVKGALASGVENKGINENFKAAPEAKNMLQTNVLANQNALLNLSQEIKFNSINRMEQARLIKDLLKLPGEIEELFSLLVYKNISSETLEALLKQNQKLNMDLIREILEKNSKESLNKLLKLCGQTSGGAQNTDQIKDILALLSQIIPKKEASAHEILTNLTLLYLPWLPLSEKQDIEIRIEKRKNKEDDDSEQTALVIYITTINIGVFKISIVLNKDSSVKIEIEATQEKDNEKIKANINKILKKINQQARKDKINVSTELFICEAGENEINSTSQKKREVVISPTKEISPILVIMAQKIAKIILEMDEKISLLQKREKILLEEN